MIVSTAHRCLDILKDCFGWDRPFRRQVLQIMLPVLLQQILAYSIGLADSLMVTGMGNAAYAAVVQANRLINIFQHLVLGIQSAAFIFLAQFAGAGDGKRLKQVMGMTLFGSGAVSLLSLLAVLLFAGLFLQITMLTNISSQGKQAAELRKELEELTANAENLQLTINQHHNLATIQARAEQLGMEEVGAEQLRVISVAYGNGNTSTQTVELIDGEKVLN